MPWFAHGDIIAVHKRVEQIVCQERSVLSFSAVATHSLETFFAKIYSPVVPCRLLSNLQTSFYQAPKMNRMIFMFKLPYLIFEIGFWLLMWKILSPDNKEDRKKISIFLALNPIVIFAVYMFGRFEAYNLFLTALLLFILKKLDTNKLKNQILLILVMAVTVSVRKSYLMILPALFLALGGISLSGLSVIGFSSLFYLGYTFLGKAKQINLGLHADYVFQAFVDTGLGYYIYWFFLLIGLIMVWWLDKQENILKKTDKMERFSLFSALIFLAYYATSIFHPQYLVWIMPFFLVLMVKNSFGFWWKSFWWMIPFYLLYLVSLGNSTTFGIAFPISMVFKQVNPGWFLPVLSAAKWANIGRSIFSAFNLYWFFKLIKQYGKES